MVTAGECAFGGCCRDVDSENLCNTHWTQRHRGRPLTTIRTRSVDMIHDFLETRGGWWTSHELADELGYTAGHLRTVLAANPDRFVARPDPLSPADGRLRATYQYRSKVALWETDTA